MSSNPSELSNRITETDGEGDFGRSFAIDEHGDFVRDPDGSIHITTGETLVNRQLLRVLRTPKGDDPLRPWLGLDRDQLLGGSDLEIKGAIIDAIGPDADPRVETLNPEDITIYQPGGTRENAGIVVEGELANGSPIGFSAAFEDLVTQRGDTGATPDAQIVGVDDRRPIDSGEGWGNNYGQNWGH